MHDLNMDYYDIATKKPHSPVSWKGAEKKFFHPWSIEESCKTFAYSRLSDLIDLKDFMTLPNSAVEQMLDGLVAGVKLREEEEAREKEKGSKTPEERESDRILKESKAMMNQLG